VIFLKIGIPKEIKQGENRVAITPSGVLQLVKKGHEVFVEKDAGVGSGIPNKEYVLSGALILERAKDVWEQSDMILKVKEPLQDEFVYFRENLILFTYLHLAANPTLTNELKKKKVTAIAYETIQLSDRSLPLLTPMSQIAGRMSIQIGAQILEKHKGGKGILLSGVPGVLPGNVVIVGGGIVGTNAAKIAVGMGADVTILDNNAKRLAELDDLFGSRVKTVMSNPFNIAESVKNADLLVGSVLIPGAKAPKLVSKEMVKSMSEGSVIVDVAIDQGGSIETMDRITTHESPTFTKFGVLHYSVANMPGAVPRTSTFALTNATISYVLQLADKKLEALNENLALQKGLNIHDGKIILEAIK
jgi:alanine dehydrogenase